MVWCLPHYNSNFVSLYSPSEVYRAFDREEGSDLFCEASEDRSGGGRLEEIHVHSREEKVSA